MGRRGGGGTRASAARSDRGEGRGKEVRERRAGRREQGMQTRARISTKFAKGRQKTCKHATIFKTTRQNSSGRCRAGLQPGNLAVHINSSQSMLRMTKGFRSGGQNLAEIPRNPQNFNKIRKKPAKNLQTCNNLQSDATKSAEIQQIP